jgi:pyruvate dehydrogenase E1 component beta subunit
MDTPIAEAGISGAGIGAALAGYRPVVDLMFSDFMFIAADEILLHAAEWRFLHGGKVNVPVVFLAGVGGGLRLGAEHSQTPSSMVLHKPGLKLVMPSSPYDAKGLLKTAIRDENPVVYFWHKALTPVAAVRDQDSKDTGLWIPDEDYTIPFGVADVKRKGSDVTVVGVSNMVNVALEVAAKLADDIDVEVIDPRTLEPLDLDTILESVEKTGRLVIIDEDTEKCSFASELGFQVIEHGFDFLDAPIKRVCAANCPIPGGLLEPYVLPQADGLKKAIEEIMC